MNKLEVGMYVRFKDKNGCTYIRKVIDGYKEHLYGCKVDRNANNVPYVSDKNIINYSFKPIDLVQVGDYVNDYQVLNVIEFNDNSKMLRLEKIWDSVIQNEDIKSIVTKEYFESMKYEVE